MKNIVLNLLENGLDYIYEAVEPIFVAHKQSQHSWKYSVLHLYSGIQLLLKERLRREHWSLIFQDINSADLAKLEKGNFVSVYHDELVRRLQNIANVTVNDEPIKNLRDLRNRFEHFEINIAQNKCEEILAAALDETIQFWEHNLEADSTNEQKEKFKSIKFIATGFEAYRKQRLEKFQKAINGIVKNRSGVIVFCPDCHSQSFVVFKDDEKTCKCFVCGSKYQKDIYLKNIREYEEHIKGGESLFSDSYKPYDTTCSTCKKNTRVRYDVSYELTIYCCLNCLHEEKFTIENQVRFENADWYERLEKAHTNKELLKIMAEKFTVEEIFQILQERKESTNEPAA